MRRCVFLPGHTSFAYGFETDVSAPLDVVACSPPLLVCAVTAFSATLSAPEQKRQPHTPPQQGYNFAFTLDVEQRMLLKANVGWSFAGLCWTLGTSHRSTLSELSWQVACIPATTPAATARKAYRNLSPAIPSNPSNSGHHIDIACRCSLRLTQRCTLCRTVHHMRIVPRKERRAQAFS